jgi:hypothetical protein
MPNQGHTGWSRQSSFFTPLVSNSQDKANAATSAGAFLHRNVTRSKFDMKSLKKKGLPVSAESSSTTANKTQASKSSPCAPQPKSIICLLPRKGQSQPISLKHQQVRQCMDSSSGGKNASLGENIVRVESSNRQRVVTDEDHPPRSTEVDETLSCLVMTSSIPLTAPYPGCPTRDTL